MDGTYDQSLHFMTAYSTNSTFAFKNVCALLKITLNGNSTDNSNPVCRVKVVANPKLESVVSKINTVLGVETSRDYDQSFTYTSIAGNFEATVKDDGTATATPKLAEGEVEKTYVELRASGDDGTAKTSLGNGTFYMVVLPAALSKDDVIYGFTIILEKKDGTIYQRVNTKQEAFERNKMYDLGIYDCSSTPTGMTSLGKDVVDLDLPSGTLWCKYNIKKDGSFESSETGFTDYFSWGYDHVVLTGSYSSFYEDDPATNFSLYTDYDMAYKKDNRYCMPVYAQMYEMYNHTNKVIEKDTHTTGWPVSFTITDAAWAKFTAATGTGRCIKIPYAGYYYDALPHNVKEEGRYWSRTKASNVTGYAGNAFCMDLINDDVSINGDWVDDANCGRSIRPVATNIKIAPILTK
jgi:hypothetical protein